ncbi:MAG: UDP-N-acetylmuramoyl-L-alanine--D-glutamate ligase [Actinobacteria bacterium]|nr:UDP-N-acetylmuramoyl-L-alanine--D-glutamate ligase [Actinomycetota bacterium]
MDISKLRHVGVMGDGVTATAVRVALPRLGCQEVSLSEAEVIVISPGIPMTDAYAVPVISEVEFAFLWMKTQGTRPELIAVTGTNGKSTVVSLLGHILDCPVAGNIGDPLINFVASDRVCDRLVVELSSFQLEGCSLFRPEVAVLLPITPDHLSRHGTFSNYQAQKAKIFQQQGPEDVVVYDESRPELVSLLATGCQAQKISYFSDEMRLPAQMLGEFNRSNINAAFSVCRYLGVSETVFEERVSHFSPLPHRLEYVTELQGRRVYNDSKATNIDATRQAVLAMTWPTHLILCGEAKGEDYVPLLQEIRPQLSSLVVFGAISMAVKQACDDIGVSVEVVSDITMALSFSLNQSQSGDVILFSASGASFDQFDGYAHRGECFKSVVMGAA